MRVRNHRILAIAILLGEVCGLLAWGRSMANESTEVRALRDKFRGTWVASSIEVGELGKVEGSRADGCSAEFAGKSVVLRGLVGGIDAQGTFYIESSHPNWIDFKLDAGWIVGIFTFEGDTLKLCVNPFGPPEQLGVPTIPRPRQFDSTGHRFVYTFRQTGGSKDGR